MRKVWVYAESLLYKNSILVSKQHINNIVYIPEDMPLLITNKPLYEHFRASSLHNWLYYIPLTTKETKEFFQPLIERLKYD